MLHPGDEEAATLVVTERDLASALSETDRFPPVYATSRMIALMEVAASRLMQKLLAPGELSVGVRVDVTHSAATPAGAAVRATATFLRMDGKLYVFDVRAEDEGGEIGRGIHARAIVSAERLMAGAMRRNG